MPPAPFPPNEYERRAALAGHCLLESSRDPWCDDAAQIAASVTGCPISAVSIVTKDRQWFMGQVGLELDETPRDMAFCGHTVLRTTPLIVPDTTQDARFVDNPLVTGPPGIRFYVGVPLIDDNGCALGSICVIDTEPREITEASLLVLRGLAGLVTGQITRQNREDRMATEWGRAQRSIAELKRTREDLQAEIARRDDVERRLSRALVRAECAERIARDQQIALDTAGIVAVTDRRGTILHVNENFCDISGYSRKELVGQNHRILNSGTHDKAFFKTMYASIGAGRSWRGEICNRAKDGSLYWVDTTIVPMLDADGRPDQYIALRIDITESKRIEASLLAAKRTAEEANRAKSDFLANMSHEIRTPMTAILGFVDLLDHDDDAMTPSDRRDALTTIRRNGEHLLSIINDVLDVSKIEAGSMTIERIPLSPARVVRGVVDLLSDAADARGVELCTEIGEGVPEVMLGDPTRLRQILLNLAGNAIKFTSEGRVTLRLCSEGDAARPVLRVDVIDTGIGMTPEQCAAVAKFAAFTQADASTTRRFGGTGLGLRISDALARLMGGSIAVASELDRGSTFSVCLPAELAEATGDAATAMRRTPLASVPGSSRPLEGLKVLLAEDGPDNQRLITWHLTRAGAEVTVVENGRLAVDAFRGSLEGRAGRFDVIIMDMQMPEMDGYTAASIISVEANSPPIFALTAHAMEGDERRCLDAGCEKYLTKPIQADALIAACVHAGGRRSAAA